MEYTVVLNTSTKEEIKLSNIQQVCCEEGWVNFWSGDKISFYVNRDTLLYFERTDKP